jgi:hypothetical protein
MDNLLSGYDGHNVAFFGGDLRQAKSAGGVQILGIPGLSGIPESPIGVVFGVFVGVVGVEKWVPESLEPLESLESTLAPLTLSKGSSSSRLSINALAGVSCSGNESHILSDLYPGVAADNVICQPVIYFERSRMSRRCFWRCCKNEMVLRLRESGEASVCIHVALVLITLVTPEHSTRKGERFVWQVFR